MVEEVNETRLAFYRSLLAKDPAHYFVSNEQEQVFCLGAHFNGQPVGIVISTKYQRGEIAQLIYMYVRRNYRRFGVGSLLLKHMEKKLKENLCTNYSVNFVRDIQGSHVIENFFSKHQFEFVRTDMYVYQIPLEEHILSLPWMKNVQLPSPFSIFPWIELTEKEREHIKAGRNEWYPDTLNPLRHEDEMNEETSLGLRYNNEIVGWLITRPSTRDRLEYATLFTKDQFQQRGRGIALILKALEIHLKKRPNDRHLYFRVATSNQRMLAFVKKRIEPFVSIERNERIQMEKSLDGKRNETKGSQLKYDDRREFYV